MVDLSSIQNAEMLRGLTEEDLAELGGIAHKQEFGRRDHVFRQGEDATRFFIAESGQFALTVSIRVFDGRAEMAVENKGPLDAFGWSSLVEPKTSIYSGYCTAEGTVVVFPRPQLEALMTSNYRLGEVLLHNFNELIGKRVRVLQKLWLDEIAQSTARVRHWSHAELTEEWSSVMTEPSGHPVRRWLRKHTSIGARS